MRLYNIKTGTFKQFYRNAPPYVIASHRWYADEDEITYKDVVKQRNLDRPGYEKLQGFANIMRKHKFVDPELRNQCISAGDDEDGFEWLWIDTCCIDKTNSVELSEAINSMYRWYQDAAICLAYLGDVDESTKPEKMVESEWFTRGWTLQELVGSRKILFLSRQWSIVGIKGAWFPGLLTDPCYIPNMSAAIAAKTGVPRETLYYPFLLQGVDVETRLAWMKGRRTTREEDMWYCLAGLLDAPIGVNYGEGQQRAGKRLLALLVEEGLMRPGRVAAIFKPELKLPMHECKREVAQLEALHRERLRTELALAGDGRAAGSTRSKISKESQEARASVVVRDVSRSVSCR